MMLSRLLSRQQCFRQTARGFATRLKTKKINRLAPEILDALPDYTTPDEAPGVKVDRAAVTSAHCIDVAKQQVSALDSAAINPANGKVVHGHFGELGEQASIIPLEYLALLRPAAEGCAAVRVTAGSDEKGTLLVYGAGEANGLAAAQVASSKGLAVVAVVGLEQSGNEEFMESVKGLVAEPGTAVPAEYALSKKNFSDLVASISSGKDGTELKPDAEEYLDDFKRNFVDYCEEYPDTRPAAVAAKHMEFEYMEKDREFWEQNMETYLEQFPPGAPPVETAQLNAIFTAEQYEIFRRKFWHQTTAVISGDDSPFSAPHLVQDQLLKPETLEKEDHTYHEGANMPYSFDILEPSFPAGTEQKPGGPVVGAIICVTPDLKVAAERVAAATTLRAKAEELQFLTQAQRAAFGAACSVAACAPKVTVIGGTLPGFEGAVEPTDADVKEALQAMDVDDDGESHLNYFVQTYPAADFPFYADYAVHRASEELAGPRQIIVTK